MPTKKGFLPLLSDVPHQRQTNPVSTDESDVSPAPRTFNEKRFDWWTGGQADGHTFIPLLPDHGMVCPEQGVPSYGPNTVSVSSRSPSVGALGTKRPPHGHREHVTEASAQENNVRLIGPKAVGRYEWPLIVNGVYQGRGPLPSCRIEDNESPTEPRPYAWPLIILHRARSVEDGDQQSDSEGKEANENTAEGEEKGEAVKTDDRSTDESRTTDGVSADH